MGNRIKSFQKQELQYYSTVDDGNYSSSDIFTCKNLPMSFIAELKLNPQDQKLCLQLSEQLGQPSRYLIILYNYYKNKECECRQLVKNSLVSYWEYYNFFLSDLLCRRVQNKTYFTEDEFWYLVMVCCGGYAALKDQKVYYDFTPDKIAVTPEGKLKLFWAHVSMMNVHLNYIAFCESRFTNLPTGYYSPEEFIEIANRQRNLKLNFEKCNIFSLGMTMLYCLSLMDPIKYFYMQYKVDFDAIEKVLKKRVYGRYPQRVVKIVEACLVEQPKNRINFDELINLSKEYFVQSSTLNLVPNGNTASKLQIETADKRSKTSRISLKRNKK